MSQKGSEWNGRKEFLKEKVNSRVVGDQHVGFSLIDGPRLMMHNFKCSILSSAYELLTRSEKQVFFKTLAKLGVTSPGGISSFPKTVYNAENVNINDQCIKNLKFAVVRALNGRKIPKETMQEVHNRFQRNFDRAAMLDKMFRALDESRVPHTKYLPQAFATFLHFRHYNDPNPSKYPFITITKQITEVLKGNIRTERDELICQDIAVICKFMVQFADNDLANDKLVYSELLSTLAAISESSWEALRLEVTDSIGAHNNI